MSGIVLSPVRTTALLFGGSLAPPFITPPPLVSATVLSHLASHPSRPPTQGQRDLSKARTRLRPCRRLR